jgi:hypothetical protein
MKRSMLRMPSKDCQAGKGQLKRTVVAPPALKGDKNRCFANTIFGNVAIRFKQNGLARSPSSTVVPLTSPSSDSTLQLDNPNRAAPETCRRVPTRGNEEGIVQRCLSFRHMVTILFH